MRRRVCAEAEGLRPQEEVFAVRGPHQQRGSPPVASQGKETRRKGLPDQRRPETNQVNK